MVPNCKKLYGWRLPNFIKHISSELLNTQLLKHLGLWENNHIDGTVFIY